MTKNSFLLLIIFVYIYINLYAKIMENNFVYTHIFILSIWENFLSRSKFCFQFSSQLIDFLFKFCSPQEIRLISLAEKLTRQTPEMWYFCVYTISKTLKLSFSCTAVRYFRDSSQIHARIWNWPRLRRTTTLASDESKNLEPTEIRFEARMKSLYYLSLINNCWNRYMLAIY